MSSDSDSVISKISLGKLLGDSLTSTPCVNVRKTAKIKVATGMLAQYLETFTDSIVVRDGLKPMGIVGGREIIQGVYKNPSSDFFEMKQIEEVTDQRLNIVTPENSLEELVSMWKSVGRAFAVIDMGNDDYSVISVKKLLEIGINHNVDSHINQIPKKKIVTFDKDATFGDVMRLMLENKTRKIMLEGTNQFINDRIVIETIEKFDYLLGNDNFLDVPVSVASLDSAKVVSENLDIADISKMMYGMSQPLVMYDDMVISPWDVCSVLVTSGQ